MSRYPVRLTPAAEQDLLEANRWYQAVAPHVVARFRLRVRETLEKIEENPFLYPTVYGNARRALVRDFPYTIVFRLLREAIQVIAITHQSRDPKIWQRRP